jgi:putative SOS response-associated peptidase YedK
MCNDYRNRKSARRLVEEFSEINIPLRFSNGIPNIEPRDDIKITDRAPIILPDGDGARLEMMRWSWPSPWGSLRPSQSLCLGRLCHKKVASGFVGTIPS